MSLREADFLEVATSPSLRVLDETGEDYLYASKAFHLLSKEDSRVLAKSLAKLAA